MIVFLLPVEEQNRQSDHSVHGLQKQSLSFRYESSLEVILGEENFVEVKGPKGKLNQQLSREMNIKMEGTTISIERPSEIKRHHANIG